MRLIHLIVGQRRPPAPNPTLTELLTGPAAPAAAEPAERNLARDARLVDDMARHVMAKVAPIVAMHGRSLENGSQATTMALEVAIRLGLEAAENAALQALFEGRRGTEAVELLDQVLQLLAGGFAEHRDELARRIEAAAAGFNGGSVRP